MSTPDKTLVPSMDPAVVIPQLAGETRVRIIPTFSARFKTTDGPTCHIRDIDPEINNNSKTQIRYILPLQRLKFKVL